MYCQMLDEVLCISECIFDCIQSQQARERKNRAMQGCYDFCRVVLLFVLSLQHSGNLTVPYTTAYRHIVSRRTQVQKSML